MFTVYKPMLRELFVFTIIFLLASMVIQKGHADPSLNLQLYEGTMPQLLESVN
jgi:hypothetical protein